MNLSPEQCAKLAQARAELFARKAELRQNQVFPLGESCSIRAEGRIVDPQNGPTSDAWTRLIAPDQDAYEQVLREILAAFSQEEPERRFRADEVWVWGGPTPQWGGSLAPDTLVRGAAYFSAVNGVYVYGPVTAEMLAVHAGFQRLFCQVTRICRAPGAQPESDEENATRLGRLSRRFPNLVGGIIDDMAGIGRVPGNPVVQPEKLQAVRAALRQENPALQLFGVVYRHEIRPDSPGRMDFSRVAPLLDGVFFWFWEGAELLTLDADVESCRQAFPGKTVYLGLFIHDYGTCDTGAMPAMLEFQLRRARALLAAGKISGLVILGDREIAKWPESAAAVRAYLARHSDRP